MNNLQAAANPAATRALGNYAIQRAGKTEHVKSKFAAHMFEKRQHLLHFNPFEHRTRKSRSKNGETAPKDDHELSRLKRVTKEAQDVIATVNSVFPLSLFPDTIVIDRHKMSIIYRTFFWTAQTVSVPIQDIKNIQADMGPFFGSLTVTSDHFINNTQTINNLWRNDAKKIQELVQGAMVANNESIDISKVTTKELTMLLTDLGKGHGATA